MSSLLLITSLLVPVGSTSWTASLSATGTVSTAAIFCPIDADIHITPQTLNVKSGNDAPSVKVHFPAGLPSVYSIENVTSVTMRVKLGENQYAGEPIAAAVEPGKGNEWTFGFSRNDVIDMLDGMLGEVALEVSGVANGCEFAGTDTITVISPGNGARTNETQSIQQESLAPAGGGPVDDPDDVQKDTENVEQTDPIVGPPADEVENVEQDDPVDEPEQTDLPLDEPKQREQEEPASEPTQDDPPKEESTVGDEDEADKEPVKTDPSGNETGITSEDDPVQDSQESGTTEKPVTFNIDEPVTESTKPEPKEDEPDTTTKEEDRPVKEPVPVDSEPDDTDSHQEDVPVKQPLDLDRETAGGEVVEQEEPMDEPEPVDEKKTVTIPIPTRPQVEQPETVEQEEPVLEPVAPELPVIEPVDEEEEQPVTPDPIVNEPVNEPEDPTVEPPDESTPPESGEEEPVVEPPAASTPPETVEEEPEAVEHCPIDAELKIEPETFDLNGEVDELQLTVTFPESVAGVHAIDAAALIEVRVKLGEEQYGTVTIEAKPDAENPKVGEFELTLEQVEKLLEGRLGELTLEVRGSVSECAFVGTDTFEAIQTEVEELTEPATDEPQEAVDGAAEGDESSESDLEQTDPVEDVQEQTEPPEEIDEPSETTEEVQEETETTAGEEETQPQGVKDTEEIGVVEEDAVEDEEPEETE